MISYTTFFNLKYKELKQPTYIERVCPLNIAVLLAKIADLYFLPSFYTRCLLQNNALSKHGVN